jgi:hypothetical protein
MPRDKTTKLLRSMKKGTPTRNIPMGMGVEIPDLSGIASNQAFKKITIDDLKTSMLVNRIPFSDGTNLTSTANLTWNIASGRLDLNATHDNTLLQLISTDAGTASGPDLVLHRDSASPTGADNIGVVVFAGDDSASNYQEYARIQGRILTTTSGAEDGIVELRVTKAGTANLSALKAGPTEVVINEDSKDIDFRVETDTNANAFVIDATNESISLGATNLGLHGTAPTGQSAPIPDPMGGVNVDVEARIAITDLLNYLRTRGDVAP